MQVTINGAVTEIPDGLTLRDLVIHLGLTEGPVAIEVNRVIVPRAKHGERSVLGGDVIEVVHFVGGG
jgi:thiamine biosynthesis protein ThiS